jgi:hypothetical protein
VTDDPKPRREMPPFLKAIVQLRETAIQLGAQARSAHKVAFDQKHFGDAAAFAQLDVQAATLAALADAIGALGSDAIMLQEIVGKLMTDVEVLKARAEGRPAVPGSEASA